MKIYGRCTCLSSMETLTNASIVKLLALLNPSVYVCVYTRVPGHVP